MERGNLRREIIMKALTIPARFFISIVYLFGIYILVLNFSAWEFKEPVMLVILAILASLALLIKVEGATNHSHYTNSFIVYGFTFMH
jgi:hypothetical protein